MPEVVDSIDSEVQIVEIYNEHFRDPIPMPCGFGWGFRVCHCVNWKDTAGDAGGGKRLEKWCNAWIPFPRTCWRWLILRTLLTMKLQSARAQTKVHASCFTLWCPVVRVTRNPWGRLRVIARGCCFQSCCFTMWFASLSLKQVILDRCFFTIELTYSCNIRIVIIYTYKL